MRAAASALHRRVATLVAAAALAGCAAVPRPPVAEGDARYSGRLAVRIDDGAAGRGDSANFELVGRPAAGRLELSTALGTLVARAQWRAGSVVLTTSDGDRAFDDLDGLTREVLGETLPVAAWFDWLRGQPWAGAPSTRRDGGFDQLDWMVDTAGLADGRLMAVRHRAPPVTVRIKLDAP